MRVYSRQKKKKKKTDLVRLIVAQSIHKIIWMLSRVAIQFYVNFIPFFRWILCSMHICCWKWNFHIFVTAEWGLWCLRDSWKVENFHYQWISCIHFSSCCHVTFQPSLFDVPFSLAETSIHMEEEVWRGSRWRFHVRCFCGTGTSHREFWRGVWGICWWYALMSSFNHLYCVHRHDSGQWLLSPPLHGNVFYWK